MSLHRTTFGPTGRSSIAVDKLLLSAPGRRVYLGRACEPRKLRAEFRMKGLGRETKYLKAAAFLGAMRPERGDDDVPAGLE